MVLVNIYGRMDLCIVASICLAKGMAKGNMSLVMASIMMGNGQKGSKMGKVSFIANKAPF